MAILKKTLFPENLERFNVLVEDTNPNSRYFGITELPDTFTGGKNAFLIQGSSELVSDTIVKIEIKDSQGNIIYNEPGEGIPEYYEGTSKVVAVYVYPDTSYGPCTITILGELSKYEDANGFITDIPENWVSQYNVRWQGVVNVNPLLANTTKIRFYRRPKVDITETILPIFNRTVNRVTISGSINGNAIQPTELINFKQFKGDTVYELKTTGSIFSSSMEGETITITGLNQEYSTIIKDVVNSTKILATTPYYETSSNDTNSLQIVQNFTSASFTLPYNQSITLSNSTISSSFAKILLTDLETFSGDLNRLKIFGKRKADIGNYTLIEDIQLESNEILLVDSYSGSISTRVGQFISQALINDFWQYKDYDSSTTYTKLYDNTTLAASVKLNDKDVENIYDYPQKLFYYSSSLDFLKNTEYQLDFTPLLSSSAFLPAKLEVYLSGSSFVNSDNTIPLGKSIVSFNVNDTFQKFDKQQINFKPDMDGTGKIIFAIHQGNWQLSNISLRSSQETNFSPNQLSINLNVPTKVNNDTYDFKFEFYDINNNYVPVTLQKEITFSGGTDTVVKKTLSVVPSSNLFSFSGSGAPTGTTTITFDITKTGLTGSVLFVSAAFDATGGYLSPSLYTGGTYPGLLTNVTDTSATLTVGNFTGSLNSVVVSRVLYTASCEDVSDFVNIYRIDQGSTGTDGLDGQNFIAIASRNQFVYDPDNNNASAQTYEYIDVKLTSNISSGSLSIISGSYLPKLTLIDTNTIGQSTQQTYRLYSGTDDEDVLSKGTNAASWSYNTPTSNTHTGTYIFTRNGFSSSVQIEGVLKGDKSKNLNATSNTNQFFYKMTDTSLYPTGQSITIDVKRNNLGSTTNTITVTKSGSGPDLTVGSNNSGTGVQSYSLAGSSYLYSYGTTTYTFTATDLNGVTYTDTITITPVVAESQVALNVSNENATLGALSTGFVASASFFATTGSLSINVGSDSITNASPIANNTFSASISSSAGVTGATITNGGIYFITRLDADSGSVKLKAVYQDGRGTQTILTKDVTYSKAKKAAPLLNISINPKAQSVSAKSTGAQVDGFSNSTVVISETYDNATTNKTITTLVANSSDIASISTTAATGLVTLNGKTLGNSTNATNVFVSASVTDSENQTRTLFDTITLSKVKKAAPTINIFASPQSQAVASNASNVQTGILSSIALSALEGASSVFTSATVAGSSGFTSTPSISSNILTLGTIADANTQASASITINYTDSEGTTGNQQILVSATKSQKGTAGTDGAIGPGVIFRGPWASGTTYFYSTGALGRRDVVLYNAGSGDTYYGVTAQHTSTNNTNSSTGYPGSGPWQSLGTDSYFVAAKIMISEDSYVKKTLNVGTNASGNANITLYGTTDKPYISVGQAVQSFGSNGIYMGVTGSAQNIVVSFASGSSYFKYNSAAAADSVIEIGGKITSTAGSIGGWSLDNGTLTGGSIVLDSINGRIIAGGLNGVVISGSAGIVAGTPLSGVRPFSVGLDGSMYASKASISGSIFATTISAQLGNIGGWCITGDGLYKYNTAGDTKVSLDSAGSQIAVVGPSSTVQIKDKLSTSFSTSGGVTSNAASAWCSINTNGAATTTFGASTLYVGMSATPGAIILHSSPQTFPNLTANATYNLTLQLKFRFKLESGYDNNSRVCTFVHGLNTTNDYYALSDYDYNPFSPNSSVGEQLYNEWIGATNNGYRYLLESGGGYENSQGDQGGGVLNAYNDLLTNYAGDSNPVLDYRNAIYGSFVPSFTISKNAFSSINTITKEIAYDTSTLSTINPTYDTTTSIPTISTIGGSAYLRPITTTDYIETSEYTLTSAITVPSTGFNTGFAISTNITNTISDAYAASYWATANYSNSGPQQSVKWDTFIETDGGSKMAKDILETDLLKVWDGENNQFIFRPYTFKYDKLYKNYYFVKVNGNEVYVSNSHNFWLENGEQINVKDLIKGVTKLFIKNGDSIIKEVVEDFYEIQSDGDEFITFSIEQYKNYLSNNIVSHNYAPIGGSGNALNFIYAVHGNLDYTCKIKNIEMQVTSLSLSAVSKFVEVTATGIQVVFDSNQTVNAFSIKGFDSGGTAITPSTSTFNLTSAGYWKHIGEIHSTGDIVGFTTAGASDERLKENIKNVTDEDYLKLKELVPVTYSWISDEEKHKHYGLIAQQVEKIFPELTRKKVFGKYMTINYIGLIPILVGMIQNQNDRIKNLENKLNGSE